MKNNRKSRLKKYLSCQGCIKEHFCWVFYNFDTICGGFKTIAHFMTIWPTVGGGGVKFPLVQKHNKNVLTSLGKTNGINTTSVDTHCANFYIPNKTYNSIGS
jgi:hypothetical protein